MYRYLGLAQTLLKMSRDYVRMQSNRHSPAHQRYPAPESFSVHSAKP